ncbi:ROK family protein [Christensenellaceae bacterium OttesenSCG-928-M15]|nr:ROK family protein [Christensenellaceae bacterium OttesenSCG-928-M15]
MERIAAMDIGGTNIKACVFQGERVLEKAEIPSQAQRGGAHVLMRAAALAQSLRPFSALGVSTAGQVDPDTGVIRYANDNIPGYKGLAIKEHFKDIFDVPVAVVNDVCAAALGEGVKGAAKDEKNYICLTYGTGVGGGIVLDGKLYHGAGYCAGSMLGGLILHADARKEGDPFAGSYERVASATALVRRAKEIDANIRNGRDVFKRLEDPAVRAAVDAWLDDVAAGLCTLLHAFNVPLLVLGGGVMEQPYAIAGARSRTHQRMIPGFAGVRIEGAKLGNMAGLYGAASLALCVI